MHRKGYVHLHCAHAHTVLASTHIASYVYRLAAKLTMASPRNSSYKVALVGTSYVGKTTLFLRLAREEFVDTTIDSVICDTSTNETTSRTTFGFDYTTKDFEVDGGRQTITVIKLIAITSYACTQN